MIQNRFEKVPSSEACYEKDELWPQEFWLEGYLFQVYHFSRVHHPESLVQSIPCGIFALATPMTHSSFTGVRKLMPSPTKVPFLVL